MLHRSNLLIPLVVIATQAIAAEPPVAGDPLLQWQQTTVPQPPPSAVERATVGGRIPTSVPANPPPRLNWSQQPAVNSRFPNQGVNPSAAEQRDAAGIIIVGGK